MAAELVQIGNGSVEEERRDGEAVRRETQRKENKMQKELKKKKSSMKAKKKIKTFSYSAQPKIPMHCSCVAKKYYFSSTIAGYILSFSGAKNSYLAPQLLVLLSFSGIHHRPAQTQPEACPNKMG